MKMELKKGFPALVLAVIVALGLIALPRTSVAGADHDVPWWLSPPGDGVPGDPDMPPPRLVSPHVHLGEVLDDLRSAFQGARILMVRRLLARVCNARGGPSLNVGRNEQRHIPR